VQSNFLKVPATPVPLASNYSTGVILAETQGDQICEIVTPH
jgi:hypothetical protein